MQNNRFSSDFSNYSKYRVGGSKIYHYTSAEGLINIIKDKQLWFSNIYFLNDNNELFYTYKLIKNIVKDLEIDEDLKKSINGRCDYMLHKNHLSKESEIWFRKNYYVASFSLDKDNLSLWNYYTKSDKTGYNIEFQGWMFWQDDVEYGKVCYDTNEQVNMLKQTILKANEEYKTNKSAWENLWNNFIIYSLFFKHENYSIEKEYRIVLTKQNHSDECTECLFRSKNGLVIPYVPYKFDALKSKNGGIHEVITGITISPLNQGEISKYGVERLCCASKLNGVEIDFSKMDMKY